MEKIKIDINTDLVEFTKHNFLYKGKRFPFNMNLMKCFSNYFNSNENYYEDKRDIDIIKEFDANVHLAEKSIQDFINFCQYKEIILNKDNVFSLHKLSNKFDVPSLSKFTQKYIETHRKELAIDFLIDEIETGTKDSEDIISLNLLDYIDDDRLISIDLPILYRIINKYFELTNESGNSDVPQELIDFLIKCLDHYGRDASVLFENFDPKFVKKETVWKLLTEYGDKFDFQFISHKWQLIIKEVISDAEKKHSEEETSISKLISVNKTIKIKLSRLQKKNTEKKIKIEEMQEEILRLNSNEENMKKEILRLNYNEENMKKEILKLKSENEELKVENKEMGDEILKLKSKCQSIRQARRSNGIKSTQMNQVQNDEINEDTKLRNYKSTSRTLFVSNLPVLFNQYGYPITDTNEMELYNLFKPYGISEDSDSITIKTKTGEKGYPFSYALIKFDTNEQTKKAISELNYEKINGFPISLSLFDDVTKNIISRNRGNLLIQNLNTNIEVSVLHDIFSQFGEIISCKIPYYVVNDFQRSKGKSRGYGYVQFLCLSDAINAMNSLNQKVINDRQISIYQYDKFKNLDIKEKYFCLCIYNLPLYYTNKQLKNLLAQYGNPCSSKIINPGFGLCTMDNHENAVKVVKGLNGQIINGNMIICQPEMTIEDKKNESINQEKKWIDLINKDECKDRIVFIKGIVCTYTNEQLECDFTKYGNIETYDIIYDENGYSKGAALICFSKPNEAIDCIRNCSNGLNRYVCCVVSLANEQNLIDLFTKVKFENVNQPELIIRYNILKNCLNYKKYLQRLDDLSSDQIKSLANNESLFNKFITMP